MATPFSLARHDHCWSDSDWPCHSAATSPELACPTRTAADSDGRGPLPTGMRILASASRPDLCLRFRHPLTTLSDSDPCLTVSAADACFPCLCRPSLAPLAASGRRRPPGRAQKLAARQLWRGARAISGADQG